MPVVALQTDNRPTHAPLTVRHRQGWETIVGRQIAERRDGIASFETNHCLVNSSDTELNTIIFRLRIGIPRDFDFEYFLAVKNC